MVFWLYEQPQSSLLWQHPRMQQYISKRTVFKSHMWMGAFGAASPNCAMGPLPNCFVVCFAFTERPRLGYRSHHQDGEERSHSGDWIQGFEGIPNIPI